MRIVVDMQGAQSEFSGGRGVGRHTRELTKGLIEAYKEDAEIFLALNGRLECKKTLKFVEKLVPRDHIKIWNYYLDVPPAGTYVYTEKEEARAEELFREWYLHQFDADVIWSSNMQEGWGEANIATSAKLTRGNELVITTLHDVIPMIYKEDYLFPSNIGWYLRKIKYACDSDIVITVSEFSKKKIIELFDVKPEKVKVVYNGYNKSEFYPNEKYMTAKSKKPYFLYVGGADQHKNLYRLIEAFSKLDENIRKKYKICFAGKETEATKKGFIEYALKCGIDESKLEFLGFVDDESLRAYMQQCAAFVFPSYSEGFGLPPLEAMACGAPTLVAKAASLVEIVDNKDALFEPYDVNDLADKMTRVVSDLEYADTLINNGLKQVEKFTWENASKVFKNVIDEAVSERKQRITENKYTKDDLCNDLFLKKKNYTMREKAMLACSIEDSVLFSKVKNIYIDTSAVVLEDYVSGIQRVVNALIMNLQEIFKNRDDIKVVAIYSAPDKQFFYKSDFNGKKFVRSRDRLRDSIVQFRDGDIFIMPDLHPSNIIAKRDYLEKLCQRGIKIITGLYDIIPTEYPQFFNSGFVKEYEEYLATIAKFSGVISISKTTMELYTKWCKKKKISFPPYFIQDYYNLGSDIAKANPSKGMPADGEKVLKKLNEKPTVLMVGTIEPRKKHDQVLHAMEQLWNQGKDINLVFVGRNGWNMDDFINEMELHKERDVRFFWLTGVSDEYLEKIYECSTGVIVASLQEGYGLPIIEAAKYKKPLLLRDIQVFREVAGENASYFKGTTSIALAKEIENWIDKIQSGDCIDSSEIKYITWEESARQFISRVDSRILYNKPQNEESVNTSDCIYSKIDYVDFEKHFRGSEDTISKKQKQYIPYFKNCSKVLDIGCGRGEFLKLLKENDIGAEGVDLYDDFVKKCVQEGLKVTKCDGIRYLESQMGWDGVFAAQLIEHLSMDEIIKLCRTAYRHMNSGAYIILETPNPTKVDTFTNTFYIDPSHNKPIHPTTMQYIFEKIGFQDVKIILTEESKCSYNIPMIKSDAIENLDEINHAMTVLNDFLFGSMDYAIVGRKP